MDYEMHVKYSTFHRQCFDKFCRESLLDHLEYGLIGRCRHSLLKAKAFKILRISITMGQKEVAL